jgi:hypothetical protein
MKPLLLTTLFLITVSLSFAQWGNSKKKYCIHKNNLLFEPSYSAPSVYWLLYSMSFATGEETTGEYGNDPVGARFEYMLGDVAGIGLDFFYENHTISSRTKTQILDSHGDLERILTYNYSFTMDKFAIMPRFAFHVVRGKRLDLYLSAAAGYSRTKFTQYSNDPAGTNESVKLPIPVAVRGTIGMHYYPIKYVGIFLEAGGYDGGMIGFGLSAKFNNKVKKKKH